MARLRATECREFIKTVSDKATFEQPHQFSVGFRYVIVNGTVTVEEGKHTGARAGTILYGPGKK